MTQDDQFLWSFAVDLFNAVATLTASLSALYLGLRRRDPRLKLDLLRPEGELTNYTSGEPVRFYHLRVRNEERSAVAEGVQIQLISVEEPGPDGVLRPVWQNSVPIRWQHYTTAPKLQTLGTSKNCDLCGVGSTTGLMFYPDITPNNLNTVRRGQCRLVLSVQARSDQVDSEVVRIEIAWDGIWENGDTEMRKHLMVRILTSQESSWYSRLRERWIKR